MKKALEGLRGVKGATVSLEKGEAVVRYDAALVSVAQMVEAVRKAGFGAHPPR